MKKNFFYTVLLSVVNILFPVLSFPYASHILGPVGIGKVQMVVSFAQYFALFAALGIPVYGVREIARHRDDPDKLAAVFTEISSIYFIASIICTAIYLVVLFCFPFFGAERNLYVYAGMLVLLSFSYTDWLYVGMERFKSITLRSVGVKALALILLYVFVHDEKDYTAYLMIVVFSILGNQLLSLVMAFRITTLRFTNLDFRKHLRPVIYIFGASIAASIYTTLDTVLLGFLSDTKSVGLYTAAVKLIRLTFPFVTAMGTILMPGISKGFAESDHGAVSKLHERSFQFLTFFSLPVCMGIFILAPELISVFSGNQFVAAVPAMQILSLLVILVGAGNFFHLQVLVPSDRNREVLLSMLCGLAIFLLLNFILVPRLHATGAAISTVCTELAVTAIYFLFIRRYHSLRYDWVFFLQSFGASVLFIPVVFLVRWCNLNLLTTLAVSVAACTVIYLVLHLFAFRNRFLVNFIRPLMSRFGKQNQSYE